MENAKNEFLNEVGGKQVLCAFIYQEERTPFVLRVGFTESEYSSFLAALDFEYDDGYGGQELFGDIWYTDGTWSERGEYDGSEWWSYQELPKIPKECAAQAEASPAQATMPQPEAVIAHLKVLWGEKYITTEVTQAVEETIDYIERKAYRKPTKGGEAMKRWTHEVDGGHFEHPNGVWVLWSDVKPLVCAAAQAEASPAQATGQAVPCEHHKMAGGYCRIASDTMRCGEKPCLLSRNQGKK